MIGACKINQAQLDGIEQLLKSLPKRVRENAVRAAIRKGVKTFQGAAKQTVPVQTGALQKSLTTKVSSGRRIIGYVGVYAGKPITVHRNPKNSNQFSTKKFRGATITRTKEPWKYAVKVEDKRGFLLKAFDQKQASVVADMAGLIKAEVEKRGYLR